ncbi:XRE family transcriptional regulator [Actinacidiphila yeochonensis]|uniref:XRE family transcriptional regulator n=1 Tax=Actinacidiphila yeochonensis TaxID=89050 RepID=UPI00099DB9A4|nr:XRE family transcriptional regulator [Actinacidiphila yeochonensis]
MAGDSGDRRAGGSRPERGRPDGAVNQAGAAAGGSGFGRLLRELRHSRGLTMEELAEASGVSGRAIGDMERGRSLRPQRGTVTALAQALRLDPAAHDELVAAARAARPAVRHPLPVPVSPCAVPRGVRDFVGRYAELAALRALAQRAADSARHPSREAGPAVPPPAAVVFGAPGSGKTTLAVQLATEFRSCFPGGAHFLDMRGLEERPLPVEEAVRRLLAAWGVPDSRLARLDGEERLAHYHGVAAGLRAVVVLDNAASEAQIRPLLPREGDLLVVVTSRRTLAGLEAVQRVELGALTEQESTSLLRAVVSDGRVDAEPEAAREVTELCGRLPLALRVAANWAATRTNWSLRHLASRLADEDRRLDALSAGDLRVNSAFSLSYSRLAPAAARMFRLLSLVPGGDFGMPLAAVLADVSPLDAEDLLEELLEAGLLMTSREDRYRFHDLLRLYARSRHQDEDGEESPAASSRLRSWLLATAVTAGRWYEPGYGAPAPDPGRLVPLDEREQAAGWLRAESDNWLAAFRQAAELGEHTAVTDVAEAMHWFSENWISWGSWSEVYERAARAAAALGDPLLEATHRNYLAWAYWACDRRHDAALDAAAAALRLASAAGDVNQQAWAHTYLGWLEEAVDDVSAAADSNRRAMELFARADDVVGYLQAANGAVLALGKSGRVAEVAAIHREVTDALADPVNRDRIPPDVRDLTALTGAYHASFACLNQGQWADAVELLRPVQGRWEARGNYRVEGKARLYLAHALAGLGEAEEAAAAYRAVLAVDGPVPPALRDEAVEGLEALAASRPAPRTRFE